MNRFFDIFIIRSWRLLLRVWLEDQILVHCSFCVRLLGNHWSVRGARQMHHRDYWPPRHCSHSIDPTSHSLQLFLITAAAYLRWMPSCPSGEKSEWMYWCVMHKFAGQCECQNTNVYTSNCRGIIDSGQMGAGGRHVPGRWWRWYRALVMQMIWWYQWVMQWCSDADDTGDSDMD